MKTDLEVLIAVLEMTETSYESEEPLANGLIIQFPKDSSLSRLLDTNRFRFNSEGRCFERGNSY